MGKYKDLVPAEFWSGDKNPKAYNVGELIEQLERLPKEIELSSGFSDGVGLVLYNIDRDGMKLEFSEIEDDLDDDEEADES